MKLQLNKISINSHSKKSRIAQCNGVHSLHIGILVLSPAHPDQYQDQSLSIEPVVSPHTTRCSPQTINNNSCCFKITSLSYEYSPDFIPLFLPPPHVQNYFCVFIYLHDCSQRLKFMTRTILNTPFFIVSYAQDMLIVCWIEWNSIKSVEWKWHKWHTVTWFFCFQSTERGFRGDEGSGKFSKVRWAMI